MADPTGALPPADAPTDTAPSSAPPPRAWPVALSALRHRNYRLFWIGQLISLFGTWMQWAAQGWLVKDLAKAFVAQQHLPDSFVALNVSHVALLGSLPQFLLILFAGVYADRHDKRRILVVTQAIFMVLALALAALVYLGHVQLWHVAVYAVLNGITMAYDMPTRQSYVKEMAGPSDLANAIALNSGIFNLARIVGPLIGGALMAISSVGIGGVFALNGLSYIAVIIGLLMIRTAYVPPAAQSRSIWVELREGFGFVRHHRIIRTLLALTALYSIFGFSYAVLMSVHADAVLHLGPGGFALLLAATGVGAMCSALLLATLANRARKGTLMLGGVIVFGLGVIAFSFSRSLPLSLALLPFVGGGLMMASATVNSLIQQHSPDRLRGRIVSMWAFLFAGMAPVGAFFVGAMARYTDVPTTFLVNGLICIAGALLATLFARWLWGLE